MANKLKPRQQIPHDLIALMLNDIETPHGEDE
jgi:hypothetical protein